MISEEAKKIRKVKNKSITYFVRVSPEFDERRKILFDKKPISNIMREALDRYFEAKELTRYAI